MAVEAAPMRSAVRWVRAAVCADAVRGRCVRAVPFRVEDAKTGSGRGGTHVIHQDE